MNEKKDILKEKIESLSEKEIEIIFNEFLEDFVYERSKQKEQEIRVLLDKLEIITKGKEIIIDNSSH